MGIHFFYWIFHWIIFSADSPVLWLQIDPKLELLRQVTFEQPDYMWQYQLRYERDVVSQREVSVFANYQVFFTELLILFSI